uniref:Uncharacterized protein n=1 Tax=Haptolina ericina TaxID=156174 RepID=A0A7S3F0W0_9EUKA|mmetsp:Transcript_4435/g.9595  ORF Transcript_4435/g.9595 Transcript_4435/m.9595 type:complete len:191 (+) Transcript_4435:80-652(+)
MAAAEVPLLRLDVFTDTSTPFSLADGPEASTVSSTGEVLQELCLTELSALNVEAKGRRPQLWVYEGQGNFGSLQMTHPATESNRSPHWDGAICVSLLPRTDGRVCFDVRDAGDPSDPPDDPTLLHFGCSTVTADSIDTGMSTILAEYSIHNKPRATVEFTVRRVAPPRPPSPPPYAQPWLWLGGDAGERV